jgi:hypothetical protein
MRARRFPFLDPIMRTFDTCLSNETNAFADLLALGFADPCTTFERWRLTWRSDGQTRVFGAVTPWFWMHR